MSQHQTNFQLVSYMNIAFGNPKGDPNNIDWQRVAKQTLNIADELAEVFVAMGADKEKAKLAAENFKYILESLRKQSGRTPVLKDVRDGLEDIHVFAYGSHHLMGIDADADMLSVIKGVMTRFIKNDADKEATIKLHAAKGVTEVYFEGEYPEMIMKSAKDQPDAPKGKFLKSASYTEPVFYQATKGGQ